MQQPNRPPKKTTQSPEEAQARAEYEAIIIKETAAASVLATCLSKTLGQKVGSCGFKAYVDSILRDAGSPADPVERMFIEQLLWAHHRLGDLHAEASCAGDAETANLHNAAAVRLMGEYRKTALALREYRSLVSPQVVVKQQNVSTGNQQVAYVDGNGSGQPEKSSSRSELANKPQEAITHEQSIDVIPQPQTRGSRQTQPVETRPTHARRSTAPAGNGADQQALDPINGPKDGSG